MRPLVAVVPSYGRPGPLAKTLAGVARYIRPDDVLVLEQAEPMGPGAARRALCEQAVKKHGAAVDVLMLDDDVGFHAETQPWWFRTAAALLREPGTGVIQLPNRSLPPIRARLGRALVPACHAFILAGEMLAADVNYDPAEYGDDVAMSLIAYFAGWRVVSTGAACICHHVSRRGVVGSIGGGIEAAHRAGFPVVCRLFPEWRELGWITYTEGERAGVRLPTPYSSVRVTPDGRRQHAKMHAGLLIPPPGRS